MTLSDLRLAGLAPAITLAITLSLAGCQGVQDRRRGEESLAAGRFDVAQTHLRRALAQRPELAQDPAFAQALSDAEHGAEMMQGNRDLRDEEYERAIERFSAAAKSRPGDARAVEAVGLARKTAVEALLRRATASAEAERWPQAREHLTRARAIDPSYEPVGQALASLTEPAPGSPFDRAQVAAREKRWDVAQGLLAEVQREQPHHLRVAPLSKQVAAQVAAHREALAKADRLLAGGNLDAAASELAAALELWPGHADTLARRAVVDQRLDEAQGHLNRALAHQRAQEWEAALAATEACLRAYPLHPRAGAVQQAVRRDGADQAAREGIAALHAGRVEDADAAFLRGLRLQRRHEASLIGLASVADRRASEAQARGRPGAALLWAIEAQARFPAAARADRVTQLRADLLQRLGVTLRVLSELEASDRRFAERLTQAIEDTRPGFVVLVRPDQPAAYALTIDLNQLSVTDHVAQSETRVHEYPIKRVIENPRYPEVCGRVDYQRRRLSDAERDYDRLADDCRDARRDRKPDATACCDIADRARARRDRERQDLFRLESERDRTPRFLERIDRGQWRYQYAVHVRTARMAGVALMRAEATDQTVGRIDIDRSHAVKDATLAEANPALGLAPDPLLLPEPASVEGTLWDQVAPAVAKEVLGRLVRDHAAGINGQARRHQEKGELDAAIESHIQAALVLEAVAPAEAQELMGRLRAALTPGAID